MLAVASSDALVALTFSHPAIEPQNTKDHYIIEQTRLELSEYFCGKLKTFGVNLAPNGTEFSQKVWQILQTIGYGETLSYAQEAKIANSHPRAVARANANNKIAIIIPCHRVIASSGAISGYAGGIWRKEFLLNLEHINSTFTLS